MKIIKIKLNVLVALMLLFMTISRVNGQIPNNNLSFEQAFDLLKQKNHVIKQVDLLNQEKQQQLKAARGLYFPRIGITAQYMTMSEDLSLDLTPVKEAIEPLYQTLSNYGNFSMAGIPDNVATQLIRNKLKAGLTQIENEDWNNLIQKKQFGAINATLDWPVYAGGKIRAANKAANIELTEVNEEKRQKEAEVLYELVERYYGLCLAKQAEKVRLEVFNGMKKHLNDAQKMEQQGLIANADLLNVKVYYSQAERELNKSHRTTNVINQALLNTLAQEMNATIEPISLLFYLDSIEPVEYFKNTAKQNNPMLHQVEAKKQLSIQGYNAEKANYFPAVAFTGMYDIANKDLSPYTPDWMVGIGLKWTLFDGNTRYRKVKAAGLKTEQIKEYQLKAASDIETVIDKLYQELSIYKEQLIDLETARTYAQEYLRAREKGFKEEMTNSTEVVDARLNLSKILIERLETIYKYDLTLAKLLEFSGIPENFITYQRNPNIKTEFFQPELK
ncbi:MAG: TolC family protein [Bacteroidetes bacterium]|nr:TolC family protein [Bacteroidota bacterium]